MAMKRRSPREKSVKKLAQDSSETSNSLCLSWRQNASGGTTGMKFSSMPSGRTSPVARGQCDRRARRRRSGGAAHWSAGSFVYRLAQLAQRRREEIAGHERLDVGQGLVLGPAQLGRGHRVEELAEEILGDLRRELVPDLVVEALVHAVLELEVLLDDLEGPRLLGADVVGGPGDGPDEAPHDVAPIAYGVLVGADRAAKARQVIAGFDQDLQALGLGARRVGERERGALDRPGDDRCDPLGLAAEVDDLVVLARLHLEELREDDDQLAVVRRAGTAEAERLAAKIVDAPDV